MASLKAAVVPVFDSWEEVLRLLKMPIEVYFSMSRMIWVGKTPLFFIKRGNFSCGHEVAKAGVMTVRR